MEIITVNSYPQLLECLAIRHKVFVEEQGVSKDLEHDGFDASPEECCHILLKLDGVPAGTGRWIPYNKQTVKIQRVAVLTEFRGKGVGKRILQEIEQQARTSGNKYCILDSQCQVESFYSQLGYLTISERPFEEAGIMHVQMQKTL